MIRLTGKDDTRFLVRGKIDWDELAQNLKNPESFSSHIYHKLKLMLHTRNQHKTFGRGSIEFISMPGSENGNLLSFTRSYENEKWLIIHNMTDSVADIKLPAIADKCVDVFSNSTHQSIEPYGFYWFKIS